jgi:hypothetical protein
VVDYLNTVLLFIFKGEPYEVLLPEIEKKPMVIIILI